MTVVLFGAGLCAAILLALVGGRVYWKHRVAHWAADNGLRLVEFRGARFDQGPRAFRRSDSQFAFRITVEDAAGRVRTGWLTFGGYWSLWPGGDPDVRWDS